MARRPHDVEIGQLSLFGDPEPIDVRDRLDACAERAVGPSKDIVASLRGGLSRQSARSLQQRARRRRSSAPCRPRTSVDRALLRCLHPSRRVDPALQLLARRAVTPAMVAERFIVLVERLEAAVSRPAVDEVLDAIHAFDAAGIAPTALSRHERNTLKCKMNAALRLGCTSADARDEAYELLEALLADAAAMDSVRDVVDELLAEFETRPDIRAALVDVDRGPPGAQIRAHPLKSLAPPRVDHLCSRHLRGLSVIALEAPRT